MGNTFEKCHYHNNIRNEHLESNQVMLFLFAAISTEKYTVYDI